MAAADTGIATRKPSALDPELSVEIEAGDEGETFERTTPNTDPTVESSEQRTPVSVRFQGAGRFGRYRIERRLGAGGFGEVYLAEDEILERQVALKVVYRGTGEGNQQDLIAEGRMLARLDHPGIVPLYDTGQAEGFIYFVSKYVEGPTLGEAMKQRNIGAISAARLIASLAETLVYAHANSVVHRDIKPNNILLKPDGSPILIDFGVALVLRQEGGQKPGMIVGTPGYMSPEQARGESHLVDQRTDLFSLGIVFFQLLTGRLPFGGSGAEMIEQIGSAAASVPSPRETNSKIPLGLEHICLKMTAKLVSERYPSARDIADDLNTFLGGAANQSGDLASTVSTAVRPKGLRPFDSDDIGFFHRLLPGLRDPAGVPESLRFWQQGIERRAGAFRVGLLYGPSGSGKSSMLRAGLLPLLDPEIRVAYVVANGGETEKSVLAQVRLATGVDRPVHSLAALIFDVREQIRKEDGAKLLIVIDQFEQWLHTTPGSGDSGLTLALRQCDGENVQVLLTIRDDFWLAISNFMQQIDVELRQSENAAPIDLFPSEHAHKVLIEFGKAYECLPQLDADMTDDHRHFVNLAIEELATDGKVIALHLTLLAHLARDVDWSSSSYQSIGGVAALGRRYLDSVFSRPTANPAHRAVEDPARAILEALLPTSGTSLRGAPMSISQLQGCARLENDTERFSATMELLDRELRLVTPADHEYDADGRTCGEQRYQLAHDFLVPSLRSWLFETRRSTFRGRAYLRLKEHSTAWRESHDRRHLLGFWAWLRTILMVPRQDWDDVDRAIMQATNRLHLFRLLIVSAIALSVGWWVGKKFNDQQVTADVQHILGQRPENVEAVFAGLAAEQKAKAMERIRLIGQQDHVNTLILNARHDNESAEKLFQRLPDVSPVVCAVAIEALKPNADKLIEPAWTKIKERQIAGPERLRLAAFLAAVAPKDLRWDAEISDLAHRLSQVPASEVSAWARLLWSQREALISSLLDQTGLREKNSYAYVRNSGDNGVRALGVLCEGNLPILVNVLKLAPREYVGAILDQVVDWPDESRAELINQLDRSIDSDPTLATPITARAVAATLRIDDRLALLTKLDQPAKHLFQVALVHELPSCGITAARMVEWVMAAKTANRRRLLLHGIGEFSPSDLTTGRLGSFLTWLKNAYQTDPDSGVHSAAGWLLQSWNEDLPATLPDIDYRWFRNSLGMEFAVSDIQADGVKRRFAIGIHEVTVSQFRKFRPIHRYKNVKLPEMDWPAGYVSIFQAAEFCNWLSDEEGIPESEWCFEKSVDGQFKLASNFLKRVGYRLPTEQEWLLAAGASRSSDHFFGDDKELAGKYAWFLGTTPKDSVWEPMNVGFLKPSPMGLFDIHGNINEWIHMRSKRPGESYKLVPAYMAGASIAARFNALSGTRGNPSHYLYPSDLDGVRLARTLPDSN